MASLTNIFPRSCPRSFTMTEKQISKRELLKKSVYVAPAILTLKAASSFASSGSGRHELEEKNNKRKGNNGVGNGLDPQPPGDPRVNDGPGTGPGNPGNKRNKRR
ncbi:MAG TPA: hypothetical protein VFS12_15480 [Terriglobia bacterium]|nr:hypothetical protein [Terriglobia bacterium]